MSRRRPLARPHSDDRRPPLERLAAIVREPGSARAQRMLARIVEELTRTPEPGPWIAAARTLAAQSVITENAALYLIERFLECLTLHAVGHDPEMLRIHDELDRVKREHGLEEDEEWYVGDGPAEWQALNADWDRRDDVIRMATLRALGHGDIADLRQRDPEEFDSRSDAGHYEFWGDRADDGPPLGIELD